MLLLHLNYQYFSIKFIQKWPFDWGNVQNKLIICSKLAYVPVIRDVIIHLNYWSCKVRVDYVKFCITIEFLHFVVRWRHLDFSFNVRHNVNNTSLVIIITAGRIAPDLFLNWLGITFQWYQQITLRKTFKEILSHELIG